MTKTPPAPVAAVAVIASVPDGVHKARLSDPIGRAMLALLVASDRAAVLAEVAYADDDAEDAALHASVAASGAHDYLRRELSYYVAHGLMPGQYAPKPRGGGTLGISAPLHVACDAALAAAHRAIVNACERWSK